MEERQINEPTVFNGLGAEEMKIIIKCKHFPREHKYMKYDGRKYKYMVGTIHTKNCRFPKFIWNRL